MSSYLCGSTKQKYCSDVVTVLVWDSISRNLSLLVSTWWENEDIVRRANKFRCVSGTFLGQTCVLT